jgi:hypothetical protein
VSPRIRVVEKFQSREAATDIPSSQPAAHGAGQNLPPLQGWTLVERRVPGAHAPGYVSVAPSALETQNRTQAGWQIRNPKSEIEDGGRYF